MIRFRDWKLTGSIDACQADHKTIVFTVTGLPKEYFKWELIWVFGSYVDILPLTLNAEGDIASKVFERENLPFAGFYTAQLRGHNRSGGTRHTNELVIKVGGTYSEDVKFPTLPNSFAAYMDALNLHEGNIENPHKTTAAQVGARPDTWTPSASDVGARPDTWLPTVEEIGAAPAGYVADVYTVTSDEAFENTIENIYAAMSDNSVRYITITNNSSSQFNGRWVVTINRIDRAHGSAKAQSYADTIVKALYGVWYPLEWVNPPMVPGVEYRTTERFNGKVVYKKAINLGGLPNGESSIAHNTTLRTALSVALTDGGSAINQYRYIDKVWADRSNVTVITTDNLFANASIIATLVYTKD